MPISKASQRHHVELPLVDDEQTNTYITGRDRNIYIPRLFLRVKSGICHTTSSGKRCPSESSLPDDAARDVGTLVIKESFAVRFMLLTFLTDRLSGIGPQHRRTSRVGIGGAGAFTFVLVQYNHEEFAIRSAALLCLPLMPTSHHQAWRRLCFKDESNDIISGIRRTATGGLSLFQATSTYQ